MQGAIQHDSLAVALAACAGYAQPDLDRLVADCLEAAGLGRRPGRGERLFPALAPGLRLLVKPNLLMSRGLACTSPGVVAALCRWLADYGVKITVADSPGFGRGPAVAKAIGLDRALRPLGLSVQPMDRPVPVRLDTPSGPCRMRISARALECDGIISVPRVKAHSQMLVTLSVKNSFGVVCGQNKAWIHARHGASTEKFASCIAALFSALPPVAALADGVCAMHVTGPSRGRPYPLRLLGACAYAPALDAAICAALGLEHAATPLGRALAAQDSMTRTMLERPIAWPLLSPADFSAPGFELPPSLAPASFNPFRLAVSCLRRLAASLRPAGH